MVPPIVQLCEIVTLLGAGDICDVVFNESLALGPKVVAADGGAKTALVHGVMPEAVIGDFDSLDPSVRDVIPLDRLHHIMDQDTTDFEKARPQRKRQR